jgi:hypothetical protein
MSEWKRGLGHEVCVKCEDYKIMDFKQPVIFVGEKIAILC